MNDSLISELTLIDYTVRSLKRLQNQPEIAFNSVFPLEEWLRERYKQSLLDGCNIHYINNVLNNYS